MTDGGPPHRPRPDSLSGVTARINTGWGRVYVTINEDPDGEPFEVFVVIGKSGGLFNQMAEGIGKTISNGLRGARDPQATLRAIGEDLEGMRSDKVAPDNGDRVRSFYDAVGIALLRYLDGKLDPPQPIRGDAEGAELTEYAEEGNGPP